MQLFNIDFVLRSFYDYTPHKSERLQKTKPNKKKKSRQNSDFSTLIICVCTHTVTVGYKLLLISFRFRLRHNMPPGRADCVGKFCFAPRRRIRIRREEAKENRKQNQTEKRKTCFRQVFNLTTKKSAQIQKEAQSKLCASCRFVFGYATICRPKKILFRENVGIIYNCSVCKLKRHNATLKSLCVPVANRNGDYNFLTLSNAVIGINNGAVLDPSIVTLTA